MNGLKRAVIIGSIAVMGLAACGDDSNSPAPAVTTPATDAMMTETTDAMMTETTDAMMTETTDAMMTDGSTTTGG